MSQVLVNFRMDEEDKKGMEEVCKELGLSMTTAFTLFAKKMRREKRIPLRFRLIRFTVNRISVICTALLMRSTPGKAKLAEHSLTED